MATVRHLRNAPVVEAVIEIQVAASAAAAEIFKGDGLSIGDEYPDRTVQVTNNFEIGLAPGETKAMMSTSKPTGYRFKSTDGTRLVDFQHSAFAFHRLKPYTNWEQVREEACGLWRKYLEYAQPTVVTRVGVRYVNRLSLPMSEDMSDYLVPGPIVPQGLPQSVQAFLSRIEIADEANGRTGVITQAFEGVTDNGELVYLLDIDAIRMGALDPQDELVWVTADKLRDFKNEMFFKSVTDSLLRKYE